MIDFKDSGCPPGDVAGMREPKAEKLSPSARPRSGHEPPHSTISEVCRDGESLWQWTVTGHSGAEAGWTASYQTAVDRVTAARASLA